MLNIGDCFTLHSSGKPHLHIVIQDQKPGDINCQVICVYLSSVGNKTIIDDQTILQKDQHSFITKRSFVRYRNALIESKRVLESRIIETYEPIDPDILREIRSQFFEPNAYRNIPKIIIALFNEWNLNQIYNDPDF